MPQHLIDYALDKAAQRLQRQEPELGVKVRDKHVALTASHLHCTASATRAGTICGTIVLMHVRSHLAYRTGRGSHGTIC